MEEILIEMGCEDASIFVNPSYETAIIGVTNDNCVVYDFELMVAYLVETEGMTEEQARDFIDYNTLRTIPYMGPQKPVIMYSIVK